MWTNKTGWLFDICCDIMYYTYFRNICIPTWSISSFTSFQDSSTRSLCLSVNSGQLTTKLPLSWSVCPLLSGKYFRLGWAFTVLFLRIASFRFFEYIQPMFAPRISSLQMENSAVNFEIYIPNDENRNSLYYSLSFIFMSVPKHNHFGFIPRSTHNYSKRWMSHMSLTTCESWHSRFFFKILCYIKKPITLPTVIINVVDALGKTKQGGILSLQLEFSCMFYYVNISLDFRASELMEFTHVYSKSDTVIFRCQLNGCSARLVTY